MVLKSIKAIAKAESNDKRMKNQEKQPKIKQARLKNTGFFSQRNCSEFRKISAINSG